MQWLSVCLFGLMAITACGSDEPLSEGDIPEETGSWLTIGETELSFPAMGDTKTISFTLGKGYDATQLTCSVHSLGEDWCTATLSGTTLNLIVERSYKQESRATMLTLAYGNSHRQDINIVQEAAASTDDTYIKVVAAEATSEEASSTDNSGNPLTLAMSYDGNKQTYFNSAFGAVTYPFYITYTLESGHTLNQIIYTPRQDSGNKWGAFDTFTIEASTADKPDEFQEIKRCERGNGVHTPYVVTLDEPLQDVAKVRFTITKAYEDRVSCAEMEFIETNPDKFSPDYLFEDKLCTTLKAGVTEKQIKQVPNEAVRELGLALLAGSYDTKYRLADFRPYQHPSVMAATNKTGKYSLRDNATGIYAEAGETLAVAVGSIYQGGDIQLLVQDLAGGYGNYKTYPLQAGYNEITTEIGGLIYVLNHTYDDIPLLASEDDATVKAKTVQIHFLNGKVQGYFDIQKHTAEDWTALMNNGQYRDIDVLGRYAHITWKLADFKLADTDILATVANLDSLVYREEEFMGLVKYDKMFCNRMHLCIDYKAASPNASDYRTVYNASNSTAGVSSGSGYAELFTKPATRFTPRLWGPAHEVGHVNQTRPGLKWIGMTEVTNNLLSLHVQTSFGEACKLQVDRVTNSSVLTLFPELADGENFYRQAKMLIIDGKRPHALPGIDVTNLHEIQLVPFWQLKLYLVDALGQRSFYHDLYEHYRTTPDLSDNGAIQLDFVRQCCAVSGVNLLDFFEHWGFLTPMDESVKDYSTAQLTITQEEVDALKAEINGKNYTPAHDEVWLITDETVDDYK